MLLLLNMHGNEEKARRELQLPDDAAVCRLDTISFCVGFMGSFPVGRGEPLENIMHCKRRVKLGF